MAEVEFRGVEKSFGMEKVIHDVAVTIPDGTFAVLVGPSGCGKSTLLRMLAGLEDVSGGDVMIADRQVNELSPKERGIAMVFQNYGLYPHMTVAQNMGFALKLSGMDKTDIRERVERAAAILDLDGFLDRLPRQLSGGQRQRVAMGRAIVRDPVVFLFDEPLSNLDAKLRVQMRAEVKKLHRRLNTTTVYVTHDQIEAMTMADMIVVLNFGRVMQIGAPLELYDRPANRFVAGFIGSPAMNFLDGVIEHGADGPVFRADEGDGVALPEAPEVADGRRVVLGIRPEHLLPAESGLSATIDVVEPTGAEVHVTAQCASVPITAMFRERLELAPGQKMHLRPDGARYHLFDPETDQRLN